MRGNQKWRPGLAVEICNIMSVHHEQMVIQHQISANYYSSWLGANMSSPLKRSSGFTLCFSSGNFLLYSSNLETEANSCGERAGTTCSWAAVFFFVCG